MTKWPVHKQTHWTTRKHLEHQDVAHIQNKIYKDIVYRIFIFILRLLSSIYTYIYLM